MDNYAKALAVLLGIAAFGWVLTLAATWVLLSQIPITPAPVEVTVVYEESGEVADVRVTDEDGNPVPMTEMDEGWLGNDDAADGLYTEDPKEI